MASTNVSTLPRPPAVKRKASPALAYLLIAPPVIIMVGLIFWPAIQAVIETLALTNDTTGKLSFTLQNYIGFFKDPILRENLWFTLEITFAVVAVLFLVGFPLAIYLRFSKSWIAAVVQVLALFPLFVPGVILAFAIIRFLGSHGMLDTLLHIIGYTGFSTPYLHPSGIIIALTWDNIPFTVLVLTAGLRQVEDSVIESARDVGANELQVFFRIILPLMTRAVIIVLCLNVIGVFGSFTLPYLIGPAQPMMMGVSMQQTYNGYKDHIGALTQAVISFIFCASVGVIYVRTVSRPK